MKKQTLSLLLLVSIYTTAAECSNSGSRHSSHSSEGEEIIAAINAGDSKALKRFPEERIAGHLKAALTKFSLDNKDSSTILQTVALASSRSEVQTALTNAQKKEGATQEKLRRKTAIAKVLSKVLQQLPK